MSWLAKFSLTLFLFPVALLVIFVAYLAHMPTYPSVRGIHTGMTLDGAEQTVRSEGGECVKTPLPATGGTGMLCLYNSHKQSMIMLATPDTEIIYGIKYIFDNANPDQTIEYLKATYRTPFRSGMCFAEEYRLAEGDRLSLCMNENGGTLRFVNEKYAEGHPDIW